MCGQISEQVISSRADTQSPEPHQPGLEQVIKDNPSLGIFKRIEIPFCPQWLNSGSTFLGKWTTETLSGVCV